jgi:hypothetical protein
LALFTQLGLIGREVAFELASPPPGQKNIGEWCKRKDCWERVVNLQLRLNQDMIAELSAPDEVVDDRRTRRVAGKMDLGIHAVSEVINLGKDYWLALGEWAKRHSPLYGKEADYVRNAARPAWVPQTSQANALLVVKQRMEAEGFRFGE